MTTIEVIEALQEADNGEIANVTRIIDELCTLDPDSAGFRYHETKKGRPTLDTAPEHLHIGSINEALAGVSSYLDCVETALENAIDYIAEACRWKRGLEAGLGARGSCRNAQTRRFDRGRKERRLALAGPHVTVDRGRQPNSRHHQPRGDSGTLVFDVVLRGDVERRADVGGREDRVDHRRSLAGRAGERPPAVVVLRWRLHEEPRATRREGESEQNTSDRPKDTTTHVLQTRLRRFSSVLFSAARRFGVEFDADSAAPRRPQPQPDPTGSRS
jgi:hypothetical protein